MCLILFAYQFYPKYKLIVAANRDEFYRRPTSPAHFWDDHPGILAGRDLEKGGTWMGVTREGRFSALTNFRNPQESTAGKRSRGELVTNALIYKGEIKKYLESLKSVSGWYPGYNLLVGDCHELYYFSNISLEIKKLKPGVYGISNHLLNTEWPKVQKGKEELIKALNGNVDDLEERLFQFLQMSEPFPDDVLPRTGVSLEWEKILSPLFIKSPEYGTRSSTVLLMSEEKCHFIERVFAGDKVYEQRFQLNY